MNQLCFHFPDVEMEMEFSIDCFNLEIIFFFNFILEVVFNFYFFPIFFFLSKSKMKNTH